MAQPRGLLAISIIVDIGEATNTEFRRITLASRNITFKSGFFHSNKKFFHPLKLRYKRSSGAFPTGTSDAQNGALRHLRGIADVSRLL
jgi:hypothetical protein